MNRRLSKKTWLLVMIPAVSVMFGIAYFIHWKNNLPVIGVKAPAAKFSARKMMSGGQSMATQAITASDTNMKFKSPGEIRELAQRGEQMMMLAKMNECRARNFQGPGCERFRPKSKN